MRKKVRPDDEDKPFSVRWNILTRALLVEPSVKLVARIAMDYADFDDGSSCYPSIDRMTRETGLSDRTVRNGWAVLRGLQLAERLSRGSSFRGAADTYQLKIPDNWESLPTLGPNGGKFTCPGCKKVFNPDGHCILSKRAADKGKDVVQWVIGRLVFCSWPSESGKKGSADCLNAWNVQERLAGRPKWNQVDGELKWKLFHEARNDPW